MSVHSIETLRCDHCVNAVQMRQVRSCVQDSRNGRINALPGACSAPVLRIDQRRRLYCRDMASRYGIKYFYDITDRSDFRANPDYKGVCHIAMAQEGHCKPGTPVVNLPMCNLA